MTASCPKCGEPFDDKQYEIIECPQCGEKGSTKCCNPGGQRTLCLDCNASGVGDDDDAYGYMSDDY